MARLHEDMNRSVERCCLQANRGVTCVVVVVVVVRGSAVYVLESGGGKQEVIIRILAMS